MEPKPKDIDGKSGLIRLNSFLLTLATGGILWNVATLNNVDKRLSNLETAFAIRVGETADIKKTQEEHTSLFSDIVIRLTKLETIQNEKHGSDRN